MKKRFIFAIAVAVVLAIAVVLVILDSVLSSFASSLLGVVQWMGLSQMLIAGTFITTRYFKVTLVLIASAFIGLPMSMFVPWADVISVISLAGILITYLIYFLGKRPKTLLDTMKLLSLFLLFPLPLYFFRPISAETKDVALLLGQAVFAVTFVLYLFVGERRNVWFVGEGNG